MLKFSKDYFKLLVEDFSGINLTRIIDFDEFYTKQILDSLAPIEQSESFYSSLRNNKVLIDVGFGGGFPILPLAKKFPLLSFIGVETRKKKVNVVRQISKELNLLNVELFHLRIEELLVDVEATITFKAVGKVYDFLSKINCEEKTQVFFYKGPNFYDIEKEQIKKAKIEWNIIEEMEIELEGVEKRYLIGFENKNKIVKISNKNRNNLVKLSELI